jgi:predicted phosphodiesterase
MAKIVVTSDQHLGYENSNVKDFINFLDYIYKRDDVEALILLGDLIDMWRRDASGLFLEFSDIVKQLLNLKDSKNIQTYIIAGNHDYHLLKLLDPAYHFNFYQEIPDPSISAPSSVLSTLTSPSTNGIKYKFRHGWEFDLAQHPIIMEAMCHNMSDEAGHARSSIYHILEITKDYLGKELGGIIDYHDTKGNNGYVENLLLPPAQRLKPYFGDLEKRAYTSVNEGEVLIFGHTHRPFVTDDLKLANTGSWVSDAEVHNTFVELEGKEIKLFQFKDQQVITEIKSRVSPSTFASP